MCCIQYFVYKKLMLDEYHQHSSKKHHNYGYFFHRNFKYTYSKQKLLGNQVMLRLFDNLKSAVFVIEIRGVWHSVLSASLHG